MIEIEWGSIQLVWIKLVAAYRLLIDFTNSGLDFDTNDLLVELLEELLVETLLKFSASINSKLNF